MAEYIDREAAFDAITDIAGKAPTRSAYEAVWKSARALKKIPAADVAPVLEGKWIVHYTTAGKPYTECASCHTDFSFKTDKGTVAKLDMRGMLYCPHCGANMEGGIDDTSH